MKIKLLLFSFLFLAAVAYGQQPEEEAYKREFNYGINFNTNAGLIGGGVLKSARHLRGNWSKFYALEIVEVKHPKEDPFVGETGNRFIFGKSNYLYVLRPQYGREYVLFRKAPESGVQVNGIFAAGPSIGLLVPYFIVYDYTNTSGSVGQPIQPDYRVEQFDPAKHDPYSGNVRGSAGFFTGLGQTNFNFGAHIKSGLSFEYGRYREDVTGVEVGFLLEAYPKKLVLLPQSNNNSIFTSVYLTLYYGRRK